MPYHTKYNGLLYYSEFGSFNNGQIIIQPVHPESHEKVLLTFRIEGRIKREAGNEHDRGFLDRDDKRVSQVWYKSVVSLVPSTLGQVSGPEPGPGHSATAAAAVRVYKGICRFEGGLAGVHTLTVLDTGEMVLHHSPAPSLKIAASRRLNAITKEAGAAGHSRSHSHSHRVGTTGVDHISVLHVLNDSVNAPAPTAAPELAPTPSAGNTRVPRARHVPLSVPLPPDSQLLICDLDNLENIGDFHRGQSHGSEDFTRYMVRVIPPPTPPPTQHAAAAGAAGSGLQIDPHSSNNDDNRSSAADNTMLSMLSTPLYISPDISPHPHHHKNGSGGGSSSSDGVLSDIGFGDMLAKYSKFGSSHLGELAAKIPSGRGVAPRSFEERERERDRDDGASVVSAFTHGTSSAGTINTRSRLHEALHGSAGSGEGSSSTGPAVVAAAAGAGSHIDKSDKALGIAERLMRSLHGASASGDNGSVASGAGSGHHRASYAFSSNASVGSNGNSVSGLDRNKFHKDGRPRSESHSHSVGTDGSGGGGGGEVHGHDRRASIASSAHSQASSAHRSSSAGGGPAPLAEHSASTRGGAAAAGGKESKEKGKDKAKRPSFMAATAASKSR